MVFLQIRLGEWDVHTDTEFHPNLEMDILSVRLMAVSSFFWKCRICEAELSFDFPVIILTSTPATCTMTSR